MRLPAESRAWLERACRIGAFALLVYFVYREIVPKTTGASNRIAEAGVADLPKLTQQDSLSRIHFSLSATPNSVERAWQHSLRMLGTDVTWEGDLAPIVLSARPVASPEDGYLLTGFSGRGTFIRTRDEIASIDSVEIRSHFFTLPVSVTSGLIRAEVGSSAASVARHDSVLLRPVLVIGKAGWETKFLLAALEEAGWKTDASILVAPGVTVAQGAVGPIDTARYSAVVALDESAVSRIRQITAFARSGGGVVLGNAAARSDDFAELRVSLNTRESPQAGPNDDRVSRALTAFSPLQISRDAVPLEIRNGSIAVAARRFDFGRVAQIAFADTWRWRMQGDVRSMTDHREWWSGVIAQVAYAPRLPLPPAADDRAPYADLVAIAGTSTNAPAAVKSLADARGGLIWILVLFALLLIEWSSRRLRGVP